MWGRIEAVLNARPLSPLTENPDVVFPLIPGHLLRGAAITARANTPHKPPLKDVPFCEALREAKDHSVYFCTEMKAVVYN